MLCDTVTAMRFDADLGLRRRHKKVRLGRSEYNYPDADADNLLDFPPWK